MEKRDGLRSYPASSDGSSSKYKIMASFIDQFIKSYPLGKNIKLQTPATVKITIMINFNFNYFFDMHRPIIIHPCYQNKYCDYMIALILRFIKSIGMMKLKTWPGGQGF